MTKLTWDNVGQRFYETGISNGVLYIPSDAGIYDEGHPWSGLISVNETPSGAEANKQYADNIVWVSLTSAEEFGASIEAYTYPDAFGQCDGSAEPTPGVFIGQQPRKSFGMSYRTILGNDILENDYGYKLHLVYGAKAAPTERSYSSVNESPEASTFSWELTTTPVQVPGHKSTSSLTIDSTKVSRAKLDILEDILYGTPGTDARLPQPAEVIAIFSGSVTDVWAAAPTYNSTTDTITIPATAGVDYRINGEIVAAGPVVITADTTVTATPQPAYRLHPNSDDDWSFDHV